MIKRLLDTNICIYIAKQRPPEVARQFARYRRGEIAISAITWGELCCGTAKHGEQALQRLLTLWEVAAFGVEAAACYGRLTQCHPNRRAGFDRLIAAHAITLGVPLVTCNTADFVLYQKNGLELENWVEA